MPTLDFPSTIRPASIAWKLRTNTQIHRSPLSGQPTTLELPGARWEATLNFSKWRRAELAALEVFLAKLRGPAGRFRLWNHARENPQGLATGDVASTNYVINNTMQGAVIGTEGAGGVLPTGWTADTTATQLWEVLGTGQEAGADYMDIRFHTNGVTNDRNYVALFCASSTNGIIPAAPGETWTGSWFHKLIAGAIPSASIVVRAFDSGGVALGDSSQAVTLTGTLTRDDVTHVSTPANTAKLGSFIQVSGLTTTGPIDFTIRVALPQTEKQAAMTTPIRTYGAAVARPAGPSVYGAAQVGASFNTWGWAPNVVDLLKAGDYFSVNDELKIITADASSDAFGKATITFEPPLRTSPADLAPLKTTKPTAIFMLNDDDQNVIQTASILGSLTLTCVEAPV